MGIPAETNILKKELLPVLRVRMSSGVPKKWGLFLGERGAIKGRAGMKILPRIKRRRRPQYLDSMKTTHAQMTLNIANSFFFIARRSTIPYFHQIRICLNLFIN